MKFLTFLSIIICFLICSCATGDTGTRNTLPSFTEYSVISPNASGVEKPTETPTPNEPLLTTYPVLSNTPTPKKDIQGENNMTTRYVSKSATNGYQIGNDGNSGLTKSLPKLTITDAAANSSAGDTIIINDGNYSEGSSLSIYNAITILPETDNAVTISTTGSSYCLILSPGAAGIFTFGKIILDGLNNTQVGLYCADKAYKWSLVLNGTKLQNYTNNAIYGPAKLFNLTLEGACINCLSVANGSNRLIYDEGLYDGAISINNCTIVHGTVGTTAQKTISFARSTSYTGTVTCSITNNTITNSTAAPGGTGTGCIQISSIPNAIVSGNTITVNEAIANGILTNINICSNGTNDGNNPIVQNNICNNNTSGGGIIINVGIDDVANDGYKNKINNSIVSGNTVTGCIAGLSSNIHGILVGNQTGGQVYNNTVSWVGIGLLCKGGTGGVFSYNIVTKALSYAFSRGCNGTAFYNNTLIMSSGYANYGFKIDTYSGVTSTGVIFKNNIVYSDTAVTWFVNSDASSEATFSNNLYFGPSTYSFLYGGTTYSTYATWKTGKEATAITSDPLFGNYASGDYRLTFASPAINKGVNVGLTKDFVGNNVGGSPCIGAYEFNRTSVLVAIGII